METDDNNYIEALDLAAECLNAWTKFLIPYISNRVMSSMECFDNQSIEGHLFSSKQLVVLPKLRDKKSIELVNREFGNIIVAKLDNKEIIAIVRLKASYAHGEGREWNRGEFFTESLKI